MHAILSEKLEINIFHIYNLFLFVFNNFSLKRIFIDRYKFLNLENYNDYYFSLSRNALAASLKNSPGLLVGFPAFCVNLISVIKKSGKKPVLIDSELKSFNINVNKIPKNLDILVVVHTFGNPVDVAKIKRKYPKLIIIEDCTHSLFSEINHKLVGQDGDYIYFSFHKQIETTLQGSVLFSKKKIPFLSNSLRPPNLILFIKNIFLKSNNSTNLDDNIFDIYRKPRFLSILSFAMKLDTLKNEVRLIQKTLDSYIIKINELEKIPTLQGVFNLQPYKKKYYSSNLVFTIIFNKKYGYLRNDLAQNLNLAGIQTSKMWFDSPVSILNTNESKGYPVSAYLAKSIINIPIHSHYSHVEIDNIFNILSNETKKVLMARNKKFTDKLSVNNIQKTALVCGGSGALGLELIKILLKSHFKVVAQYNSHQNELYFLREKFKRNLFLIKINFLNKNLSYTNMLRIEKFLNGVGFGLIINTVAIVHFSYFSEISENEINKIYKLNLISQIILLKRIMRNLTCPAMLVTIITDSINNLSPGVSIYRSSKAALESFNKSLSVELYNQLIKIMCFSPYEFNSRMNPDSKYFASKTAKKIYSCLEKYNIKSGSNIIIK